MSYSRNGNDRLTRLVQGQCYRIYSSCSPKIKGGGEGQAPGSTAAPHATGAALACLASPMLQGAGTGTLPPSPSHFVTSHAVRLPNRHFQQYKVHVIFGCILICGKPPWRPTLGSKAGHQGNETQLQGPLSVQANMFPLESQGLFKVQKKVKEQSSGFTQRKSPVQSPSPAKKEGGRQKG